MPHPHHSSWDTLAKVYEPSLTTLHEKLPRTGRASLISRLGRTVARLSGAQITARARSRRMLDFQRLTFRRLIVILTRRPMIILGPFLMVFGPLAVVLAVMVYLTNRPNAAFTQPGMMTGFFVFIIILSLVVTVSKPRDTRPMLAVRMRRESLLRSSPRAKRLHIDAALSTSADDLRIRLERRRDYWLSILSEPRFKHRADSQWLALFPVLYFLPQILSWNRGSGFGIPPYASLVLSCGTPFLALGAIIATTFLGKRRLGRLSSTILSKSCPDCGYSLETAGDADVPRFGPIRGVGPRVCIECGSPWPLIPPPAAREAPKP
jgi:hypothetical protein